MTSTMGDTALFSGETAGRLLFFVPEVVFS
jgi:hypothetical protein